MRIRHRLNSHIIYTRKFLHSNSATVQKSILILACNPTKQEGANTFARHCLGSGTNPLRAVQRGVAGGWIVAMRPPCWNIQFLRKCGGDECESGMLEKRKRDSGCCFFFGFNHWFYPRISLRGQRGDWRVAGWEGKAGKERIFLGGSPWKVVEFMCGFWETAPLCYLVVIKRCWCNTAEPQQRGLNRQADSERGVFSVLCSGVALCGWREVRAGGL